MSITLKGLGSAVDSVNGKTGVVVLSPEDLGADSAGAASAVIVQHEAAADPHPQYLTETEADAKYALIGSGGTGGDPAGTAAALLAAHEAAVDPHPQYLTQSEGDTQYAPKTHSHTSSQISDFSEAVEDIIGGSIVAGAGVSVAYDDGTGKTTISASGGGGGVGYAVQTRNGSLANQVHAFSLPAAQSSYGFDAYALKEEAGLTNQAVTVESFDSGSPVNYEQTGALVWNGQVRPYTGEAVALQSDGQFFSAALKADGKSIEISASGNGGTVFPAMTGPADPSGYSAFASSVYNNLLIYQPWYAFDKTNAAETANNTQGYWVSGAAPTTLAPQWIEIRLPQPTSITGYSVRNRNYSPNVASANSWQLQGSNDGVDWQTLHSVNVDARNTAGLTRFFDIGSETEAFSRFRLSITARNGTDNFVAVSELDLFLKSRLLIKDQAGIYYSASAGVLSAVTEPANASDFDLSGFTISGAVGSAQLAGKLPIRVVAATPATASSAYAPYAQIAIPNSLLGAGAFSQINSATVTATQTGNGKVRLAASRDLVNWHAWDGSTWISIGTLAANNTSAESLLAVGMAPATVGAITAAQWTQFFAAAEGGLPDKIAFAYALDVPAPATDVASIDNVALNVNYNSAWLKQTPAQVEIRWYKDQVTFKTITAGNYKLAYQTP